MIRFLDFQETSHYQDGKSKPNCRFFKGHQNIAKEFVAIGKHVVDSKIMQTILNALLVSYESFIQSIMVQDVKPSFDTLISKLFVEGSRRELKYENTLDD